MFLRYFLGYWLASCDKYRKLLRWSWYA